jgi:hypothetical protein
MLAPWGLLDIRESKILMSGTETSFLIFMCSKSTMDLSVKTDLDKLRLYLSHLPATLPLQPANSVNNFQFFAPDPQWVDNIGEEGAVNRGLEISLGSRAHGPIQFKERGPGIIAIADALERYLEKHPSSVILRKWLTDMIDSAVSSYRSAGLQVRP